MLSPDINNLLGYLLRYTFIIDELTIIKYYNIDYKSIASNKI